MSALGLHQCVPRNLLTGKWLIVLHCYLDDSGKDPQNPITTIGGLIAKAEAWEEFERAVEPIFERYAVPVLQGKKLHRTEGCFDGWTRLKKQSFVAQISREMNGRVLLAVSMSALKGTYALRAKESDRKRTVTPYTFCFNIILDWTLTDRRIGKATREEGIAFIVESGHENNPEAEHEFHWAQEHHRAELGDALRSIGFVPKRHSRAIQMADLFAFYTRRDGVAKVRAEPADRAKIEPDVMLKIITEGIEHRVFVATEFDAGAGRSS